MTIEINGARIGLMSHEFIDRIRGAGKRVLGLFQDPNPGIKEVLTSQGLGLTYSSHPEEVNQTIDKMRETAIKRKDREGKEPEIPSNIEMSKPDGKGKSEFHFTYHDQEYTLVGKSDLEEFTSWITGYTKTAESCITCDRLLFPGEPVGGSDKGLMHMTFGCCPSGGFYAGHVSGEGKLTPLTKDGLYRA